MPFSLFLAGPLVSEIIVLWTDLTNEKVLGRPIVVPALALTTIHAIVKPVELSRETNCNPRCVCSVACRVWVHTNIRVWVYVCPYSAVSTRIARNSYNRSKCRKCSWKIYIDGTTWKINARSPLYGKSCWIITWNQLPCICCYLKNGEKTPNYLSCFPNYSCSNPKRLELQTKLKKNCGQRMPKSRYQRLLYPKQ